MAGIFDLYWAANNAHVQGVRNEAAQFEAFCAHWGCSSRNRINFDVLDINKCPKTKTIPIAVNKSAFGHTVHSKRQSS